ncbi:sulfurtransferase [Azorhizobium oxalatiphilum]|uniref:Sulfurtransferase n=1 Tax=Azorhizobium oxalatiphilum TaxID=980631 RepID=A0A917BVL7_9HYPH|nr:rhodanese-like domain-containing protein [Azorhizobium oxalatiphilum]GGF58500.1 sulfurtransferase [Azorhizobium oxalatiphilum]
MTTVLPNVLAPVAPFPLLTAAQLRDAIAGSGEIAILDVRDEGVRSRDGHILQSVPLPLSLIELRIATLVPRQATRLVIYDDATDDQAFRAALKLRKLGYPDVSLLDGGIDTWRVAGFETYTGSNVLSKAFGEFVEHAYNTPHLSAREVKQRLDAGEDIVVLDGRTLQEFENFSIPGAHAVPNAELPYRIHEVVKSPETLVVVNCAGRTRSIIGAQALINAGVPNKVAALENGTMAWLFEGYKLDEGRPARPPEPSAEAREKARGSVAVLTKRFGIRHIDAQTLATFRSERDSRSLYVYDVRTRAEYEAGHLPGALWAEGGQLVQAVDRWVGTRNSRIVLVDDADGVRAAITASWLVQLGWREVYVLALDLAQATLEQGPERPPLAAPVPEVESVSPHELERLLAAGEAVLFDLDTSLAYRAGHVPGARFAIRARLVRQAENLPAGQIILTSPDATLARFAAEGLTRASKRHVRVLAGGTAAWRAAGLPLETGDTRLHHPTDDVWRSPYQVDSDRHQAFRDYLAWEIGLLDQLARDGSVSFATYPAA